MRHDFLSLADHSGDELRDLLDVARLARLNPTALRDAAQGRTLALVLRETSARALASFDRAMRIVGGRVLVIGPDAVAAHRGSVADLGVMLSQYADLLAFRRFAQEDLAEIASRSRVPVINARSDRFHPCQVLADLFTMRERFGRLDGLRLAFVGDGSEIAHSLLIGAAQMGMTVAVAHPRGYAPAVDVVTRARELAAATGGAVLVTEDPVEAVTGADVVVGDAWADVPSDERASRREAFAGFRLDEPLIAAAAPHVLVLHALPATRDVDITSEVLEGPGSRVFVQAENRVWAQVAVVLRLLSR